MDCGDMLLLPSSSQRCLSHLQSKGPVSSASEALPLRAASSLEATSRNSSGGNPWKSVVFFHRLMRSYTFVGL